MWIFQRSSDCQNTHKFKKNQSQVPGTSRSGRSCTFAWLQTCPAWKRGRSVQVNSWPSTQLLKIKSLQLKRYIRDQHLNVSRWDSLRPFSAEEDTVVEPAHFTCPPLLRLFFGIEMINMSHMLCFQNVDGAEYERERWRNRCWCSSPPSS